MKMKSLKKLTVMIVSVMAMICQVTTTGYASPLPNGGWNPLISPDGKKVAFLSSSIHMPGKLWVMNVDGSHVRQLTSFGADKISWSNDGETIFFSRWGERSANQWKISADGEGKPVSLSSIPASAVGFAFSPDRMRIAYLHASEKYRNLRIKKVDGSDDLELTENLYIRNLVWSPDGQKILLHEGKTYGSGIYTVDVANGKIRHLSRGFSGPPVYSVKGDKIAFVFPWGKTKEKRGRFGIRVLQADGKEVHTFEAPHLEGVDLLWSPDGNALNYIGSSIIKKDEGESHRMTHTGQDAPEEAEEIVLWQLDLTSGEEKQLSPPGFQVGSFSWSPEGKALVLGGVGEEGYGSEIWRLTLPSEKLHPLIRSRYVEWNATPSPDTTKIVYLSNRNQQGMLVVADDQGREIRRFDPFPIQGDDRIAFLASQPVLFLYNSFRFQMVDLGEQTQFHLDLEKKFKILDLRPAIQGARILFNSIPTYDGYPILSLITGEKGKLHEVGLGGKSVELQPRWSIDGTKIVFTDGTDLWIMNPDGKDRRLLTHYREAKEHPGLMRKWLDKIQGGSAEAHAADPFWSPDGKRIGFVLTVYDQEAKPRREIWWTTPEGKSYEKIYSERIEVADQSLVSDRTNSPFFDLDGNRVVFTSIVDGLPNLQIVNLSDQNVKTLTTEGALFPALLPEQDSILYTSLKGEEERIMIIDLDGSHNHPFLNKTEERAKKEPRRK